MKIQNGMNPGGLGEVTTNAWRCVDLFRMIMSKHSEPQFLLFHEFKNTFIKKKTNTIRYML